MLRVKLTAFCSMCVYLDHYEVVFSDIAVVGYNNNMYFKTITCITEQ